MDIRKLILRKLAQKKTLKVSDIVQATSFSRAYINRFFQELQNEGKIILLGKANRSRYASIKTAKEVKKELQSLNRILRNKNLSEDLALDEIKQDTGIFLDLPQNLANVVDYGFTEMLNNAIEHSQSPKIVIKIKRDKSGISFEVIDFGIGIFKHVMRKWNLKNELEAIQDILKGKQTTAPREHTGEGIFFTSKAADILTIRSSKKKLIFHNILDDVFIKDAKYIKGTKVVFFIGLKSKRKLADVFRKYSGDSYEFSKTKVTVKLYEMSADYISRSQARRILSGLDAFKEITFDFNGVETVGQAFVDEVFRIWQSHHRQIKIITQNANENIEFMIKRSFEENSKKA
ncbi:MAG: DUF4325 domain-containing protein [Patescibacteria group bacterium]